MTCVDFSGALCRLPLANQLLLLVFVHDGEMNMKEEMEEVLSRKNVCFRGEGSSVELFYPQDIISVDIKGLVKINGPLQQPCVEVRYRKDQLYQDSSLIVCNVKDHFPQLVFKRDQSAESSTIVTLAPFMRTLKTPAEDSHTRYEKKRKQPRKTSGEDCRRKQRRGDDQERPSESGSGSSQTKCAPEKGAKTPLKWKALANATNSARKEGTTPKPASKKRKSKDKSNQGATEAIGTSIAVEVAGATEVTPGAEEDESQATGESAVEEVSGNPAVAYQKVREEETSETTITEQETGSNGLPCDFEELQALSSCSS